jgi:hypothetical protein
MSGGREAGTYARAGWAANLLLSLLGEQEQVGVMVNEYLQIYKKRRGEEEGVFVFARDYRRGYWAEAPLAPSELATLLALLLAPPQEWKERLAGERYVTLVVNGYVRVEKGERDGALYVAVSDYRKNYSATAVYLASDRERFIKYLANLVHRLRRYEISVDELTFQTVLTEPLSCCGEDAPAHVKAARQLRSLGERVKAGDTVSFVMTKEGAKAAPLARLEEIDVDWYIEYLRTKLAQILVELMEAR